MAEKTSDLAFPSQFGRYQLLDRLAAGGMAEVFRARSASDGNRLIAIKCMLPALVDDEEFANMFVDEAKLASQLSHPNIVQIYELGRHQEQLFIAMELIHGRDLRAIVRKAKKKSVELPAQFVVHVVAKAAEALDYAHRKTSIDGKPLRLVHRDVSPQNILVGYDGNVKVVDFGIAKADFRRTASRVGILKGKFAYMAPEQVKTGDVDGRTDIFALGAVLYEAFAQRKLFYGESDFSILERVTNGTLPDENAAWDRLPPQVAAVVRRAVHVDPGQRYQEASHMSEELEPLLIDGRTVYGAKQARELMEGLFASEIADNDHALRGFAATAGEASGILRRPSQRLEKIDETEARDEPARRDWSIVTRDPTEHAERQLREHESAGAGRSGHDVSNTSTERLHDTSTRPQYERHPSERSRSEVEATQVIVPETPELMQIAKTSSRARALQPVAVVTETAGVPLINGVLGSTAAERTTRLTWAFTGGAVALLVLLVIVSFVKAAREEAPKATEEQPDLADVAERPAIPRITTTPLGESIPSAEELLPPVPAPVSALPPTSSSTSPRAAAAAGFAPAPADSRVGYLTVRTIDGRPATVFIDKKEVGQSPLVKQKLPLGEHTVRVVDKANRTKVLQVIVTLANTKAKPAELEVKP